MKLRENSFLLTAGSILTILVVYLIIRFGVNEASYAVVPGWHTVIYPPDVLWIILTILMLVSTLIVHLIFKLTIKLLALAWSRIKA